MNIGASSNREWPKRPIFNIQFIGIGFLLVLTLVVTEVWEYFEGIKNAEVSARTEAMKDAEYFKNAILKLILSSDIGGAAIDEYVKALNQKDQNKVRFIHSASIEAEYGKKNEELPINKEEEMVLRDGQSRTWETEDDFVSVHPFIATAGCQKCHQSPNNMKEPVPLGYVIGLMEVFHSKQMLKETEANLMGQTIWKISLILILTLVSGYGLYRLTVALRQSEQRTTAIIKTVGEGIIVTGSDSRIWFLNQEACSIFGYSEKELLGQSVEPLMPKQYEARHMKGMGSYSKSGQSQIIGRRIEVEGVRKDGTIFPLELRLEETLVGSGSRFVTGAIRDITERKQAQLVLEQFSRKLVESQENERRRIALELHDGFGQNLLVIKNGISKCLKPISTKKIIIDTLKQMASVTQQSIDEAREIAYDLHPHKLDKFGLQGALNSTINKSTQLSGLKINSTIQKIDGMLPKEKEIHLYRIIQEGLNNVIKHSHASEAEVKIEKNGKYINIIIFDNGNGFDVASTFAGTAGFAGMGLTDISERVKMLNGNLSIESSPGNGTTLKMKISVSIDSNDC